QRDVLEELPRIDVKADGSPRNAGKLWFAVNYRACGKPAAGTCWGW
ncbi:MAG: chromosome partitioning protein ParB, partial [Alcaligenes sp.]